MKKCKFYDLKSFREAKQAKKMVRVACPLRLGICNRNCLQYPYIVENILKQLRTEPDFETALDNATDEIENRMIATGIQDRCRIKSEVITESNITQFKNRT